MQKTLQLVLESRKYQNTVAFLYIWDSINTLNGSKFDLENLQKTAFLAKFCNKKSRKLTQTLTQTDMLYENQQAMCVFKVWTVQA